jgi:hypothetical protein
MALTDAQCTLHVYLACIGHTPRVATYHGTKCGHHAQLDFGVPVSPAECAAQLSKLIDSALGSPQIQATPSGSFSQCGPSLRHVDVTRKQGDLFYTQTWYCMRVWGR